MTGTTAAADDSTAGETYNAFGSHGVVIEDPAYRVWLADAPGRVYGMTAVTARRTTPRAAAEWLYMAVHGVSFGEVAAAVERAEPVVVVEGEGSDQRRFDAVAGDELE